MALLNSVCNARYHLLEILKTLDYDVSDYTNYSPKEIEILMKNTQLDMLLHKKNGLKLYVKFYICQSNLRGKLNDIINDLYTLDGNNQSTLEKEDVLFIITSEEPNESLLRDINNFWNKDKIYVVVENILRLQSNILKHVMVPPHRVMSESEVNTMMNRYNIKTKNELPNISRFDPVAKLLCVKPGEVVEITRPSKTAINSLYYRVCI